jgi:stearoyl-CoA desaturase (Delta-9 desaturase)
MIQTVSSSLLVQNDRIKLIQRIYGYPTIIIPTLGLIVGAIQILYSGITLLEFWLFLSMYFLTIIGISVGFHRLLTHRSFQTGRFLRATLAILGSMAALGPVILWCSNHRRHHIHSEKPEDPHSPYIHRDEILDGKWKGFWHSHIGWLFNGSVTNSVVFSKELLRDPVINFVNKHYMVWVFLGLLIPAILGGCLGGTWMYAFHGFIWGGLVRMALVQNVNWCVGSICHMIGTKPLKTNEESRNIFWLAVPFIGESWHNNHHAFPDSAITGFEWWQIDISGWLIQGMKAVGLVWDVRVPTRTMIEKKKVVRTISSNLN